MEGETKFSKLPRPPGAGGAPAAGGPQGCLGSEDEDPGYESDDPDDPYWDDEDSSVSSRWRKLVEEASMGSTAGSSDGSGADGAGRAPGGQDVKAKDLQFLFLAMTEEVGGSGSSRRRGGTGGCVGWGSRGCWAQEISGDGTGMGISGLWQPKAGRLTRVTLSCLATKRREAGHWLCHPLVCRGCWSRTPALVLPT